MGKIIIYITFCTQLFSYYCTNFKEKINVAMAILIGFVVFLVVAGVWCYICIRKAPSDKELWGDDEDID